MEPDWGRGRVLAALAVPREFQAVARSLTGSDAVAEPWTCRSLSERVDAVLTGVGKSNAAGAVARVLDPARHAGVISLGVGGALPNRAGCGVGSVVAGAASVYADEGLDTPDGFVDCATLGFSPGPAGGPMEGNAVRASGAWLARAGAVADLTGVIATVSTCSGLDGLAQTVADRTGACVEAMEGAAVGHAVARLGAVLGTSFGFVELRVVSNTTGDRARQRWDLDGALARLGDVAGRLLRG